MWCFDSDLNQMQSDVFNKKAEWLEAGGGNETRFLQRQRNSCCNITHNGAWVKSRINQSSKHQPALNFLIAFTVTSSVLLAHVLSASISM